MTKCAVLFCKSYSNRTPNVSFHIFPADPSRKRKWVEAVRRQLTWIPNKHHSICSIHFRPECFNDNSKKQKKLHKDAIPTLYLPEFQQANLSNSLVKTEQATNEASDQVPSILANLSDPPSDHPKIQRLKRRIKEQTKKINRLQYRNRCLKKKVASLQEMLDSSNNKSLITDEDKIR